ncbi:MULTISPECIES: contractile injection system tape measure protein [unclassified Tolypothrix]|uniref:contractile injection system tape measure protein n=1 Tax=unclassified Tolypothrix TaxID=2649714 RepID=UPI0005EAC4E1|nr:MULTISPECIES: contractile injection system tape measure protein [unclassified Tolypothrix]BAY90663.1 hypothetical protein NIES3275_26800 [Microchaete diplosiphon NIES-3275]EKF01516.1 hypothetical protein FDUTEX481_07858 [Tolypothrix sp. PCC 7601]MBE9082625.1 hypothetical protein [Tolypothrix sp. LEGE 11397]UYD24814.1 hypothetical protein HGR01_25810 [Tolypothrix sp. PCC 7712]UYD32955.1 hypothetical protein HG267_28835 [Tolypothrix sp. PCC 7601]
MSQQRHIIAKTVLEIDTGNLADVSSLQEDVSRLLQQQIAPKMERLFDQLVEGDRIIRLDQLVVEVGSVDRQFLADEFSNKLLAVLEQTLRDRLSNPLITNNTEIISRDRSGADWEVLLYFLQFGRLPWWVTSGEWEAWFSRWLAVMQTETAWRLPLQELLATNPAVRQRLVEQLPETFRHQMILQLQPAWTSWATLLTQARQLIQSLEISSSTARYLDRQAWLLILSEINPQQPSAIPLPAEAWSLNWLTQLVQTGQVDAIAQQKLRSSIAALPISEKSLWLNALAQVLNLTSENLNLSAEQNGDRPITDGEILLYFLAFGHLPPGHSSGDLLPRWEAITQTENNLQIRLRELLINNPAARQRLIAQLTEGFRHQLILKLQPAWTNWRTLLAQARELIQSLSLSDDTCQQLERQAWLLLLAEIDLDNTPVRPLPVDTWSRNWLAQLLQTAPELREIPRQILSQYLRDIIEALPITEKSLWQTALNQVLTSTSVDINTRSQNLQAAQTLSPAEEIAGLFVNQAGLVLLHPFLRNYFHAVGLLDGDAFADESAQQTAIYLLHYLATRQTDAPEYELVLPKLLCGWLLNEPVNRNIELPEAALMEAENLLQTVINYWQALKSASPDGLRQGFLQREGKLTRSSDGNWQLQVEQQSIDILLSRLPWGLSMVKLPWMEELLIVEWN